MVGVQQAFVWMLRASRVALFALGPWAAAACAPEPRPLAPLRLLDIRPRERSSVYLNEPLVLHFSADLERASVTPQSVRIISRAGESARGARFVVGRELTFMPDPVLAADLRDGGYLPNTSYVVELAGFPRADALRGTDGACLASTLRIEFQTVAVDPRNGPVFIDDSPDQARPLLIRRKYSGDTALRVSMTARSGFELEGEEPIDPSTLSDDDFALVRDDGSPNPSEYPLREVLLENFNKRAVPRQGTTLLRLLPRSHVPPGDYRLHADLSKLHLRDFRGHQIPVIGLADLKQLRIKVMEGEGSEVEREYLEEFLDTSMRSSALVGDVDGTVLWSNTGRAELRFPAAAGDGADAERSFSAAETLSSLAATRLSVPDGVYTKLDAGAGLCVLACQGAMEIDGRLERLGETRVGPFPEVLPGDTLTDWIARQRSGTAPVTVLVAGGDLRLTGELDVPGPLLLVAGGRVRVSGRIRVGGADPVEAGNFKSCSEAGAIALWLIDRPAPGVHPLVDAAHLTLDPPRLNPLVRPLVYAVRSISVPVDGRISRWLPSEPPRGRAGGGKLHVRYLGERRSPDAAGNLEVEVDDPALLVDCPRLRLVLRLEMPVAQGAAWDPPSIDSVRVRWETQ